MSSTLLTLPSYVAGLPPAETLKLQKLVEVFNRHQSGNAIKHKYYEGNITINDVNLGIAVPNNMKHIGVGCAWGQKTVDVLAARSMFDGFVDQSGSDATEMDEIVKRNNLITEYNKATRAELEYGCVFATLSQFVDGVPKIRFHSPRSAAALWSGEKGRIDCGLAIIDTKKDETDDTWQPSILNLYTDDSTWVITRGRWSWQSRVVPHRFGQPLMVPLTWNATSQKPFGRSRLKMPIRELINGYVRTIINATIGLEFATSPQKYLLGITDEQYDAMIDNKFKQYVGSIMLATPNPETGQNPQFGQLAQGNIAPHVEMLRILATQFSAATGLTVTDTGVVNDANPTSSDAIMAQSQTLIAMAEQLNQENGDALSTIARMTLAMQQNISPDQLSEDMQGIMAHFKNPSMPSVSVTADAAIKIASARPNFSQTDTFLEMVGFSQADIRRIRAQESRARGLAVLEGLTAGGSLNTEEIGAQTEQPQEEEVKQ
jgi:hypothetical protein